MIRQILGQLAYAGLFCVVLPAALWLWAGVGDGSLLPLVTVPQAGGIFAAAGGLLFVWAVIVFIAATGKLPLSIDRPAAAVVSGPYAVLADPLYAGFCALVFGTAWVLNNRFGLWIVAPAMAAATFAFVVGYENARRPPRPRPAMLDWPVPEDRPATPRERQAACLNILLITAVFLFFTGADPACRLAALSGPGAAAILIASGAYEARQLRRGLFVFAAVTAISTVSFGFAPGLAGAAASAPAGAALAAFGVIDGTPRRLATLVLAVQLLVAVAAIFFLAGGTETACGAGFGFILGCLLPGMHHIMVHLAKRIANSWSALQIGPVRIINYAVYPFLAAFTGAAVFQAVAAGPAYAEVLIIALCGTLGAGIWGNLIENTGRLARPFGYFGAILGGTLGVFVAAAVGKVPMLAIGGAAALAAPWVQAIGRLRCLVQGCCHGGPLSDPANAIVYRRVESRVVKMANLGGVPVHPTPLYSLYGNLLLGVLLLRLALAHMPASMLAGVYLIGAGVARFIEERFRGEPQTRTYFDLKLYQWLALGEMLAGAVLTALRSEPLVLNRPMGLYGWAFAVVVAAVAATAMGMDFPNSRLRFSRLTPK